MVYIDNVHIRIYSWVLNVDIGGMSKNVCVET